MTTPPMKTALLSALLAVLTLPLTGHAQQESKPRQVGPAAIVSAGMPMKVPPALLTNAPQPTPAPAASGEEPEGAARPSVFKSQAELARKRAGCQLEWRGAATTLVAAEGGDVTFKFTRLAGAGCLNAVSADAGWVEANLDSGTDQVVLTLSPNTEDTARSAQIYVATGTQSFSLHVRQRAPGDAPAAPTPTPSPAQKSAVESGKPQKKTP